MKADFYIHGVAQGQEIWGGEEDKDYIRSFYTSSTECQVNFVVEVIPAKKKTFYTYLRSKNVYGAGGREGSYFGMTISFDETYCTDTESLFQLLDTIFAKLVTGTILQYQNGNYRFLSSFEAKKKELEDIRNQFLKQLDYFSDKLETLDGSFATSSNGHAYYNLGDIEGECFYDVLKKTLKVYVSPEYPTKDKQIASLQKQVESENARGRQLADEKARFETKFADATEKVRRCGNELQSLRQEKQQFEKRIEELIKQNERLEKELRRNTVGEIHGQSFVQNTNRNKWRALGRDIALGVIFLLGVTTIVLLLWQMPCAKQFKEMDCHEAPKPSAMSHQNVQPKVQPQGIIQVNVSDGEIVEPGKEYIAKVRLNVPVAVRWKVDGAFISEEDRMHDSVRFKPLAEKDTVYLTVCAVQEGSEIVLDKKIWSIKK